MLFASAITSASDIHQTAALATSGIRAGTVSLTAGGEILRSTPIVQQYNASALERQKAHKEETRSGAPPQVVRWAITADDAASMRRTIGASLEHARVAAEAATASRKSARRPRPRR